MTFLLRLLTSRLAGPILGGVLLFALIGNGIQFFHGRSLAGDLADSKAEVTRLTGDNAVLKANNAVLKASITTQNTAIDGLKSAADLAAANAKLGQAALEANAVALDRQAASIGKLPPLPPGTDHCAAASALIRNTLAGEHQK
jgi:cell division protein FtsB